MKYCYQCELLVNYLFPDGRCKKCTRLTPDEVMGQGAFIDESFFDNSPCSPGSFDYCPF